MLSWNNSVIYLSGNISLISKYLKLIYKIVKTKLEKNWIKNRNMLNHYYEINNYHEKKH